jgi:hypothetical protein
MTTVAACADDERAPHATEPLPATSAIAASSASAQVPSTTPRPATTTPTHPTRPGPYRARGDAAVRANATCEGCHPTEAKEWRASRHRTAETNPAYRRAFAVEPAPFCRGCHAPEAPLALDPKYPTAPPERSVAELGVGCVTCHVVDDGTVLAAPRANAQPSGRPIPHGIARTADFANTGACASCHEFPFPGKTGGPDSAFMQTTVREHAASAASDRSCASCHMPDAGGRRSHTFAATRDPAWLRESVQATATSDPVGAIVVTLRAIAGHAVPTGDLFRRLEVGAERVDRAGKVVQRDVRWLARHFEIRVGERGRTLVRDDRLRDGPAEITLDVACPPEDGPDETEPGGRVRWWVKYQRVAEAHRGDVPADADVESEVLLHEGAACDLRAAR